MAKRDDIPKTDPSEIEALIQRLKQSNLESRDAQLIERLLRLVLSMASLLQHKNASIKRLKRLIFGPSSDKRAATGSSTEEEAAAPGEDSEQQPGSACAVSKAGPDFRRAKTVRNGAPRSGEDSSWAGVHSSGTESPSWIWGKRNSEGKIPTTVYRKEVGRDAPGLNSLRLICPAEVAQYVGLSGDPHEGLVLLLPIRELFRSDPQSVTACFC